MDAFWEKGGLKSSGREYANRRPNRRRVGKPSFVSSNKSGRPNSLDSETLEKLLEVYYTKPYSYRRLANMFGVSRMTVWRAIQEVTMQGEKYGTTSM